jgi:hypothetical protein
MGDLTTCICGNLVRNRILCVRCFQLYHKNRILVNGQWYAAHTTHHEYDFHSMVAWQWSIGDAIRPPDLNEDIH